MNTKIRKVQILLLQLYTGYRELDHAWASYKPLYSSFGTNPTWLAERERKRAEKELKRLYRRIDYLRRLHYVEIIKQGKEGKERLLKLTDKGQYEILRLRFAEHILNQKKEKWGRKWHIVFFDVPESLKKHRNFFRRLLKQNGFKMIQKSVWITPYDPQPHLDHLLKHLKLEKFFEVMEAECDKCSQGFLKKYAP